jgi:glucose-1-phosphatase
MKIEALIFDIGNVLVAFDWQLAKIRLQADCANLKTKTDAEEEFRELITRLDGGGLAGEAFVRLATRTLGFAGDEREFVAIWNSIFRSNQPMEQTILFLKERFPLFLLSNTSDLHLAYLKENYDVLAHFKDGVYSFQAKCLKPDRRIFEIALKQFSLKPENTAYIDDLEQNVRSASDLGFRAIQYDLTKHAEFEQRLGEFGVQV